MAFAVPTPQFNQPIIGQDAVRHRWLAAGAISKAANDNRSGVGRAPDPWVPILQGLRQFGPVLEGYAWKARANREDPAAFIDRLLNFFDVAIAADRTFKNVCRRELADKHMARRRAR